MECARLLREARTLARVAHPNVVSVFDVGTVGDELFVAMEFVEGVTLSRWLRQRMRTTREIVDVFVAAARGLAAAHRAHVIHRDFKPDNVMVDGDGRVRVLDFGLARAGLGSDRQPELDETLVSGSSSALAAESLTREGALLGTPAYMAPELWRRAAATASTDQFAFCVAFWEGLYGQRPFRGETMSALARAVTVGKPELPNGSERRIAPFLRRVLERGLATAPERRFASMDDLLAALARGPAQQRRRMLGLGLGLAALVPVGMLGLRAQRAATCVTAGAEIDATWNDESRAALHAAIAATGLHYAEASFQRAAARIDVWAGQWSTLRTELCHDAIVAGTLSPEIHALAAECLEERRDRLAGMLAVFAEGVASDVERLVPAAADLDRLEPCVDGAALARRPRAPEEPETRAQALLLRADLMRIHGLWVAGRYQQALTQIEGLLAVADGLGYRPLETEARALFATVAMHLDHFDRAEDAFQRVYTDAGALGRDEMAADAAVQLVRLVGVMRQRPAEGRQWALSADLFIRRLGQEQGLLGARLLSHRALVIRREGNYDESLADQERALAIREELLGRDHPEVATSLSHVANIQRDRGELAAALVALERALTIREQAFGPDHPTVAAALNDLALLQQVRGKYPEAQALLERALVIAEAAWGAEGLDAATILNNLGRVRHMRGDYGEAQLLLERALAIRERLLAPDDLELATSLQYLGLLHMVRGDRLRARELLERGLAIRERHMDPSNPEILNISDSLGSVYYRLGDYDRSLAIHEQTLAAQRVKFGPRHASVAHSLRNLALVRHALGEHEDALASATEALTLGEAALGPEHPDIATFLNTLGTIQRGRDPAAAEANLTRALALSLRTRGPKHPGTAMSMQRIGEVLLDRGALDEAEAQLAAALAIREAVGPGSPEVADVLVSLADVAIARGQHERAIALLERAVAIRSAAGIPIHELTQARARLAGATRAAALAGPTGP
ncbi:serine/threonine-protein kinase [Nannocystis sp.]|uniref:serine/threonine-protein kinase n=1 Tax=Nannocystis sp. TaxID=1962667 RepID=UPI0025FD34B9|nr:serine/threonine-protein kinase [Nannocystis sp.]